MYKAASISVKIISLILFVVFAFQANAALTFSKDLYYGLRNNSDVKRLQAELINRGYLSVGLNTGSYLSLTKRAIQKYQKDNALPQTGYFGPRTRQILNSDILGNTATTSSSTITIILPTPTPFIPSPTPTPITTPTPLPTLTPAPAPAPPYSVQSKPQYNLSQLAIAVHNVINNERIRQGLKALAWDNQIANLALSHSNDQTTDNQELTNPNVLCNYPIIRHEDFTNGFTLRDRLLNRNISFRTGGENIVLLPLSKDLVYQYGAEGPAGPCRNVSKFEPDETGQVPQNERTLLYQQVLTESLNAVRGQRAITFVNKNWYTPDEVVTRAAIAWLNSPGHRANILDSGFTLSGVGIAMVNDYLIITQNFVGR